jgi:hypothetical protein
MHLKTSRDDYISTKDTLAATLVWRTFVFPPHPNFSLHFHIKYNLLGQGARQRESRQGGKKFFTSEEGKWKKEERKEERKGKDHL